MKLNKGFSLIELMIVVGIIGILSLIALPFYNDYIIRVRIAQAISESTEFKNEIFETLTLNDRCKYNSSLSKRVNFKTEVVDSIDLIFPYIAPCYIGGYYRINLNKDAIGLTALYPNSNEASMIYVAFISEGEPFVDETGQYQSAADVVGPFCGQGGIPEKPEYILRGVPRKYLPLECRDGGIDYTPIRDGAIDF